MSIYIMPKEVTVSARVSLNDLSLGVAASADAGPVPYNFITDGTYAPVTGTPVPCSDESKGALLFTMEQKDNQGNPVQILVGGVAIDAFEVPLDVYAVDGLEPYLSHNGPTLPGTYHCRLTFRFANLEDDIEETWEETWVLK